jgi:hypothetical protein
VYSFGWIWRLAQELSASIRSRNGGCPCTVERNEGKDSEDNDYRQHTEKRCLSQCLTLLTGFTDEKH